MEPSDMPAGTLLVQTLPHNVTLFDLYSGKSLHSPHIIVVSPIYRIDKIML